MSCASSAEDVDDDDDKRVLFTFFAGALRRLFLRPMVEDIIALLMMFLLLLLLLLLLDIIIIFLPSSLLCGRGSAESNLSGAENCGEKEEEEEKSSFSSFSFSSFCVLFFFGETNPRRFVCALVVRRGNNASTTAMTLVANDIGTTKEKNGGDGRRRRRLCVLILCACVCVFALFLRKVKHAFLWCAYFWERAVPSQQKHKNTYNYLYFISHPTQEQQQRRRDDFIYYHIAIENIHALRVHLFLVSSCSSHCFCHHHHHHHHQQQQQQQIRVSSPTHDFCLTPPSQ